MKRGPDGERLGALGENDHSDLIETKTGPVWVDPLSESTGVLSSTATTSSPSTRPADSPPLLARKPAAAAVAEWLLPLVGWVWV